MKNLLPYRINSITQLHKLLGLAKPLHPLVSLVRNCDVKNLDAALSNSLVLSFYKMSLIDDTLHKIKYGQTYYDFDEGGMVFVAPEQVLSAPDDTEQYNGFNLFVHPDFLHGFPLAAKIKKYNFFSYATFEALHLSDKEKTVLTSIFNIIEQELNTPIDSLSQDVVVSQIELLLTYSQRYYTRQFVTRKALHSPLLEQFETMLSAYFEDEAGLTRGLPAVQHFAGQMNVSAHYLGDMLRASTGLNAQQHIHEKLIEKAKTLISTTNLSVSEIAYQLGFEHPQSFHKLFKSKTGQSPRSYKSAFN